MFNWFILALAVSSLDFLYSLDIKFVDPVNNYSLALSATNFSGRMSKFLMFNGLDIRGNFIINEITEVTHKVYSHDLLYDELIKELAPADSKETISTSMRPSDSNLFANKGDLGVYVKFFPDLVPVSKQLAQLEKVTWMLYMSFHKPNATALKTEGFQLFSYALKASYWGIPDFKDNLTLVWLDYPSNYNSDVNEHSGWYANSTFASNFLCSSSRISLLGDVDLMFSDLRVTANLNSPDSNTVYAVCSQDCVLEDKLCLKKGKNCANSGEVCPQWIPESTAAYNSAVSTYNFVALSYLPILMLLFCL